MTLTTVWIFHTVTTVKDYTLSTRDVADRLGIAQDTVSRWADDGRIACIRTPGGWRRFRPQDVEAFVASLTDPEPAA